MIVTQTLPLQLHHFFWDTDPATIETNAHKAYIIERLLMIGDLPSWTWLKQTYGRHELAITAAKSRQLKPKDAVFFSTIFNQPLESYQCMKQA